MLSFATLIVVLATQTFLVLRAALWFPIVALEPVAVLGLQGLFDVAPLPLLLYIAWLALDPTIPDPRASPSKVSTFPLYSSFTLISHVLP